MAKQLTEKQRLFLAVLFTDASGDIHEAKRLAGYSSNTPTTEVIRPIKEEVLEATKDWLAYNAPKAAMAYVHVLTNPGELENRDRMAAANQILDRIGVIKTEKVDVASSGGVMLMPQKKAEDDDDYADDV